MISSFSSLLLLLLNECIIGQTQNTTTTEKVLCGNSQYCYYINIDGSIGDKIVDIQGGNEVSGVETEFIVYFINQGPFNCINPLISFRFELGDYSAKTEFLRVTIDNNNDNRIRCNGDRDNACGIYSTCLNNYNLLIDNDTFSVGQNYSITIYKSANVRRSNCQYTVNAELTLTCDGVSDTPTLGPTDEPSAEPSVQPTTSSPTTSFPTTSFPTTSSPTTSSPTTSSPTTSSPTTSSPTTSSPTTSSPTTSSPTTSSPTNTLSTTPSPNEAIIYYYVNISNYQGNTSVIITNTNINIETTFIITFINQGELNCNNPLLTFIFEEIDYNKDNEYLDVFDNNNNNTKIARCHGGHYQCGNFKKCFQDYQIADNPIISESYTITIIQSSAVDALCSRSHPYSTNAELILSCGLPPPLPVTTDTSTDNTGCSNDEECGFAFRCDQNSALCVRDCDSFHIEEYLQCSPSFMDVQDEVIQIDDKLDIIDGYITHISKSISDLDQESRLNMETIIEIQNDIFYLHKKSNDSNDKIERFDVKYPIPFSAQRTSLVVDKNINNKPESKMNRFKTKDISIIGALSISILIGIYSCVYKRDYRDSERKYKQICNCEVSDMDVLSEQQVLN